MTRTHTLRILPALLALAAACGGSGDADLSADVVTNLPAGTGTGTAASGTYTVQIDVTACSGACTSSLLGVPFSICNVGPAGSATLTVKQLGGRLVAETDSSSVVVQDYSGGINADGTYDIGGVAMQVDGQPLSVTARARGTLTGASLSGTVDALGTGMVDSSSIDCLETLEITGSRTAG